MAESSFPWDGTTVGDATEAEYSSDEFAREWFQLVLVYDRLSEGIIDTGYAGLTGGLVVAAGAGSVTVQTGAAIVDGRLYKSTAVETHIPSNPVPTGRADRVVLRRDTAAQTVRQVYLEGAVGVPPTLTHDAAQWEILLAEVVVATGPTITSVTNAARAIRSPLGPGYQANILSADFLSTSTGAWINVGTCFITVGPGKWMLWGSGYLQSLTTAGTRGLRLYDNTGGSLVSVGAIDLQAPAAGAVVNGMIPLCPVVVDFSVTTQVRLQMWAVDVGDTVFGGTAHATNFESRCTAIAAIRVI